MGVTTASVAGVQPTAAATAVYPSTSSLQKLLVSPREESPLQREVIQVDQQERNRSSPKMKYILRVFRPERPEAMTHPLEAATNPLIALSVCWRPNTRWRKSHRTDTRSGVPPKINNVGYSPSTEPRCIPSTFFSRPGKEMGCHHPVRSDHYEFVVSTKREPPGGLWRILG